jgi:hypothetical protein
MAACERISSSRIEAIAIDSHDAGASGGRALLAGENIPAGSVVSTGPEGRAALMLLPNMLVRLDRSSEIQIEALKFAADGNETEGGVRERTAAVRIRRGHIVGRVEQHGYNVAGLTIQSSRAEMHSDGNALFEVTDEQAKTIANCVRGHLDVFPFGADHVSTLWPGETMRIDSAGSHHEALTAAERTDAEKRCEQAETALLLGAAGQMEARR